MTLFHQSQLSLYFPGMTIFDNSSAFANFARNNIAWVNYGSVFNSKGYILYASALDDSKIWIVDSGVTNHKTPHKYLLHNLDLYLFLF